jgi:protein farnesyltransferase/geranylgeranyltransferase type-1 subunit alpha
MCGANGCYCSSKDVERGAVPAKQARVVEAPPNPTMSASKLIRTWLSTIFLTPYHLLRQLLYGTALRNTLQVQEATMPKFYHDDEAWADVEPLPQDDGSLHPLAAIAYTEEYSEAMGYLRAVMANNEFSDRVLGLTEHIISMNPAHYTVW